MTRTHAPYFFFNGFLLFNAFFFQFSRILGALFCLFYGLINARMAPFEQAFVRFNYMLKKSENVRMRRGREETEKDRKKENNH